MKRRSLGFATVLLLLVAAPSLFVAAPSTLAQSGPQPGTADPMGRPSRYYLLRDDDIFAAGIPSGFREFWDYTYFPDGNLNLPRSNSSIGRPANYLSGQDPQLWSASGRILSAGYDQAVYANRTSPGWLGISFLDKSSPVPTTSYYLNGLADRVYTSDLLDIGAGDLDKVEDSANQYHDEVVVAYASGDYINGYQVNVTVLDYTSVCSGGTSNIQPCGLASAQTKQSIDPFEDVQSWPQRGYQDNILGVAVGDFDANGLDEIAVAYAQNQSTIWLSMFRYTNDGKGNRTLAEVASQPLGPVQGALSLSGALALEAADFDGVDTNAEELILGQVQFESNTGTNAFSGAVSTISVSNALKPSVAGSFTIFDLSNVPADQPVRMELAPGLFQFDPATGYDFGRRQFAVGYNDPQNGAGNSLNIAGFTVGDDLSIGQLWGAIAPSGYRTDLRFSIAAGGYRGVANGTDPRWGVAYMVNFEGQDAEGNNEHIGTIDGATGDVVQDMSVANHAYFPDLRMQLVNYDYDGDSVYLGAPVHYTVDGVINTDFVLQEPPKHSYYDIDKTKGTYGQIVTVSRLDNFNVQLQDSNQATFSATSTDTSSYDVGSSLAVSASATVSAGGDIGIANVSGSVTTSFDANASYDYKANNSSYDKSYASRTVSFSGQTNRDDYLEGRIQVFDIWRYRIFGVTTLLSNGATANGFYEIILPGPVEKFAGGGLSFDWYQPTHENGNILSYPSQLGTVSRDIPDDLGVYADTQGVTVTAPLVPASQQAFDGTSGSVALQYSSTSGSGYIHGYSHTLTNSFDISRSSKVTASVFGTGGTVQTSVKVGFNSGNSFGRSATSNQTTGTSTGITLNKIAGASNHAYFFSPIFYITQDGTVKAAHSADVLGNSSGTAYWAGIYGNLPDAALNLPGRFNPVLSGSSNVLIGWQPDQGTAGSTNSSRKQLRGFSLRDPKLNPISGVYDYLAYAPAAGDQVRIESYVYNYSTGQPIKSLLVEFQAIPYDSDNDVETPFTSCPRNLTLTAQGRCVIGQTTIGSLNSAGAGSMTTAAMTWDTTGFGPSAASETGQYRIYVVLDPHDSFPEIYDTEKSDKVYPYVDVTGKPRVLKRGIDPGQNNEGYGYATITSPSTNLQAAPPADVYLRSDSLAVVGDRSIQPRSDTASVTVGQVARVRLTLATDRSQREFNDVLIYDGDPNAGGVLIAQKTVFAGDPDGSSVWFNWQPTSEGPHTLYAKAVKDHDDPRPDNNLDTLAVQVVAPRYTAYSPLITRSAATRTAQ